MLVHFVLCSSLWAQENRQGQGTPPPPSGSVQPKLPGVLQGTVLDKGTGDALIGVQVVIDGLEIGSYTDINGNYTLNNIPEGTHTVLFNYIGYQPIRVTGFAMKQGEKARLDIQMMEESLELDAVVIEAKAIKNSESSLLAVQQRSSITLDAIAAEQFTRTGDNTAAAALSRVTGIALVDGKYIVVRGLSDRYTKTTLNGAEIPGLDPNLNTVQLDIFPSALIENIVVYKTFSPELPGSFSGGMVDISLKDFPARKTFNASMSLGYNTRATFNDQFKSYEGGSRDWLGFDDGTRDVPPSVLNNLPTRQQALVNPDAAQTLTGATRDFNRVMTPSTMTPFLNQNLALSYGNTFKIKGRQFGVLIGGTYRTNFQFYDDGSTGIFKLTGQVDTKSNLDTLFDFDDSQGTQTTLMGAAGTFSYELAKNHRLSLNLMYNHSGEKTARFQEGAAVENAPGIVFQTRTLGFTERSLAFGQLKGEHVFPKLKNARIDWFTSYTFSSQQEPDLRFFSNNYTVLGPSDTLYEIRLSNYTPPARFYRDLTETNTDSKLNFTLPFKAGDRDLTLKFGGSTSTKQRDFAETRYEYASSGTPFNGSTLDYLSDENLSRLNPNGTLNPSTPVIVDASEPANIYDADQQVFGAYGMLDLMVFSRLRFVAGARMEYTNMSLLSRQRNTRRYTLEELDLLPAANLIFLLNDNMNLRLSYGRTLARPNFREFSLFASFDFVGGFVLIGNPDLQRSVIDNIDLRWELFTRPGEILSASVFYKRINDPIVRVVNPVAANLEFNFRNLEEAVVYGLELDYRKRLDFITPALRHFKLGVNASYIYSRVSVDSLERAAIQVTNPGLADSRPLSNQSPYLFNAYLLYENPDAGWLVNLAFNIFGPRLSIISLGGTPDIYEQPRGLLDLMVEKQLGTRWALKAQAQNLLNPRYRLIQTFKGTEYEYQSYRLGQTFSLGATYAF